MFKVFVFTCMLALAAAAPKPDVFLSAAFTAPYTATYPAAVAYSAPLTYSAYPAPFAAYSAYAYASPYSAAYLLK